MSFNAAAIRELGISLEDTTLCADMMNYAADRQDFIFKDLISRLQDGEAKTPHLILLACLQVMMSNTFCESINTEAARRHKCRFLDLDQEKRRPIIRAYLACQKDLAMKMFNLERISS